MMETCLICGSPHKNAIRGGKVALLRDCFKRGHKVRRSHVAPEWLKKQRADAGARLQETWKRA